MQLNALKLWGDQITSIPAMRKSCLMKSEDQREIFLTKPGVVS